MSRLASQLEKLVREFGPAHHRFTAIRDQKELAFQGTEPRNSEAIYEWLLLNEALGDSERTLMWFDRLKNSQEAALIEEFKDTFTACFINTGAGPILAFCIIRIRLPSYASI
jgi:hypothetical protein